MIGRHTLPDTPDPQRAGRATQIEDDESRQPYRKLITRPAWVEAALHTSTAMQDLVGLKHSLDI